MTLTSETPDISSLSIRDQAAGVDNDELERFRREWKEEVARKVPHGSDKVDKMPGATKSTGGTTASGTATEKDRKKGDDGEIRLDADTALEQPSRSSASAKSKSPRSPFVPRTTQAISPTRSPLALPSPLPALRPVSIDGSSSSTGRTSSSHAAVSTSPTKIPFRAPQVRKDRDAAISIYSRAVMAEQSGKLNEALSMYRAAFKMDDNVDRLYQRQVAKRAEEAAAAAAELEDNALTVEDVVNPTAPEMPEYDFRRHIQVQPDHERSGKIAKTSRLTQILKSSASVAAGAEFAAADDELPVPISTLPAELVEPVLAHLDVASIEALGATCWRARELTAYAGVWRRIMQGIFRPPMIPPTLTAGELTGRHQGEWRTALVEEERVRLDGCYIAVCHYVRPGAGEEWVAVTHLITYHRFLRFFPDGLVISFRTNDHPSDIVPHLNPQLPHLNAMLRGEGLQIGRWRLVRSDDEDYDEVADLTRAPTNDAAAAANDVGKDKESSKKQKLGLRLARVLVTDLVEPGVPDPKYEFEMHLALRETHRGRWNKLDLLQHTTINLTTGEVLNLPLRHQKPFYFSKVRSWSPSL